MYRDSDIGVYIHGRQYHLRDHMGGRLVARENTLLCNKSLLLYRTLALDSSASMSRDILNTKNRYHH